MKTFKHSKQDLKHSDVPLYLVVSVHRIGVDLPAVRFFSQHVRLFFSSVHLIELWHVNQPFPLSLSPLSAPLYLYKQEVSQNLLA